ncbi:MAG: hypothetical protein V4640_08195 [Verrucomicrobiota bacterium]
MQISILRILEDDCTGFCELEFHFLKGESLAIPWENTPHFEEFWGINLHVHAGFGTKGVVPFV